MADPRERTEIEITPEMIAAAAKEIDRLLYDRNISPSLAEIVAEDALSAALRARSLSPHEGDSAALQLSRDEPLNPRS